MCSQALVFSLFLAGLAAACAASPGPGRLILAEDGQDRYRIVVGEKAAPGEKEAAAELQSYLKRIAKADLPIASDRQKLSRHEIIVGRNRHLSALRTPIPWKKLGGEGFVIRAPGDRLVIAGGPEKGTLYGVYTFLEEHLGCRWYSSNVNVIPTLNRVEVEPIESVQTPAFAFRSIFYRDMMDQALCARLKPARNVAIQLCDIECPRENAAAPIASAPENTPASGRMCGPGTRFATN
ncbi:MAG: hypothetical protein IT210_00580 [Armatimonadetes bacterium]|nr:hypothetical protein [Armatimonadota bacterium]